MEKAVFLREEGERDYLPILRSASLTETGLAVVAPMSPIIFFYFYVYFFLVKLCMGENSMDVWRIGPSLNFKIKLCAYFRAQKVT